MAPTMIKAAKTTKIKMMKTGSIGGVRGIEVEGETAVIVDANSSGG